MFENWAHHWGRWAVTEGWPELCWQAWVASGHIAHHSQEAGRVNPVLGTFFTFLFGLGPQGESLSSVKPLWIHPPRHTQRCASVTVA